MHCGARHALPPRYPTAAAPRQLRQQGKNSMSQLVTIKGAHRSLRVPTPLPPSPYFQEGTKNEGRGSCIRQQCLPFVPAASTVEQERPTLFKK
jgi:hypothetical protein